MDRHWIINNLYVHLNKKVRPVLVKGLLEGPPRPSITYEDHGILPEHFGHPNIGASKIWKDPAEAAALVKNLNKLIKLGAVARPIPLDADGRGFIMGKPIFMVNSFGVSKDCKTRNVTDFSQTPRRSEGLSKDAKNFCYNDGWTREDATMGFANIKDYSALLLALGPTIMYGTTDYSGWFNNLYSPLDLVRYHCMPVCLPDTKCRKIARGKTPIVALPIMTTCQGAKVAANHCAQQSYGLMHAIAEKLRQEVEDLLFIRYEDMRRPSDYGLSEVEWSYREMRQLKDFRPKISHKHSWMEAAHDIYCRWRTMKPGDRLPRFVVHQDDNLFACSGEGAKVRAFKILKYMHKQFRKAHIPVSTECSIKNIESTKIFCGLELRPGMKISFSEKRWEKYSRDILTLGYRYKCIPLGFLMSLAGKIGYIHSLFPATRAFFGPFTWWLAQINRVCKEKKRLWRIWKKKFVSVPPPLVIQIFEGWNRIYRKESLAIDHVKIAQDAETHFSVDWCPIGGGSHNFDTNEYFVIVWPEGHELTQNRSTFGEFFMFYVAARTWYVPGKDMRANEDNEGCIAVIKRFMSRQSYGDMAIVFGRWAWENNVKVFPSHEGTKDIIADPLSRSTDEDWYEEYCDRCNRKGTPVGKEISVDWEPLWEEVLQARRKYPSDQPLLYISPPTLPFPL